MTDKPISTAGLEEKTNTHNQSVESDFKRLLKTAKRTWRNLDWKTNTAGSEKILFSVVGNFLLEQLPGFIAGLPDRYARYQTDDLTRCFEELSTDYSCLSRMEMMSADDALRQFGRFDDRFQKLTSQQREAFIERWDEYKSILRQARYDQDTNLLINIGAMLTGFRNVKVGPNNPAPGIRANGTSMHPKEVFVEPVAVRTIEPKLRAGPSIDLRLPPSGTLNKGAQKEVGGDPASQIKKPKTYPVETELKVNPPFNRLPKSLKRPPETGSPTGDQPFPDLKMPNPTIDNSVYFPEFSAAPMTLAKSSKIRKLPPRPYDLPPSEGYFDMGRSEMWNIAAMAGESNDGGPPPEDSNQKVREAVTNLQFSLKLSQNLGMDEDVLIWINDMVYELHAPVPQDMIKSIEAFQSLYQISVDAAPHSNMNFRALIRSLHSILRMHNNPLVLSKLRSEFTFLFELFPNLGTGKITTKAQRDLDFDIALQFLQIAGELSPVANELYNKLRDSRPENIDEIQLVQLLKITEDFEMFANQHALVEQFHKAYPGHETPVNFRKWSRVQLQTLMSFQPPRPAPPAIQIGKLTPEQDQHLKIWGYWINGLLQQAGIGYKQLIVTLNDFVTEIWNDIPLYIQGAWGGTGIRGLHVDNVANVSHFAVDAVLDNIASRDFSQALPIQVNQNNTALLEKMAQDLYDAVWTNYINSEAGNLAAVGPASKEEQDFYQKIVQATLRILASKGVVRLEGSDDSFLEIDETQMYDIKDLDKFKPENKNHYKWKFISVGLKPEIEFYLTDDELQRQGKQLVLKYLEQKELPLGQSENNFEQYAKVLEEAMLTLASSLLVRVLGQISLGVRFDDSFTQKESRSLYITARSSLSEEEQRRFPQDFNNLDPYVMKKFEDFVFCAIEIVNGLIDEHQY